jgi:hypothetical protein
VHGGLTGTSSLVSFDPPLDQRLRRLRAQGATVSAPGTRAGWARELLHPSLLTVFFFLPMMTLIAILTIVALVLLAVLVVIFITIAMVPTILLYGLLFAV